MGEVKVTKANDLKLSGGQTEGMTRLAALTDVSDQICGTCMELHHQLLLRQGTDNPAVMIAKPHTFSAVHHHGEEDTIVYAAKGFGTIVSEDGKKRQDLAPGDWALIPAYAEHQEVNGSDDDIVWVIVRGGRNPIVENLQGWGESKRA
jgi:uncharacterized RmlC-like cupin family protein